MGRLENFFVYLMPLLSYWSPLIWLKFGSPELKMGIWRIFWPLNKVWWKRDPKMHFIEVNWTKLFLPSHRVRAKEYSAVLSGGPYKSRHKATVVLQRSDIYLYFTYLWNKSSQEFRIIFLQIWVLLWRSSVFTIPWRPVKELVWSATENWAFSLWKEVVFKTVLWKMPCTTAHTKNLYSWRHWYRC